MFSRNKDTTVVGLDIETASLAATEVCANGSVELRRTAVGGLGPGLFREGEVHDVEGLAEALGAFFADHELGRSVRLGVGNQKIAMRTIVLPALDDRKEMDAAVRFKAQEAIPMPLDQAVLDYQVARFDKAEGGERTATVVLVAARRDMIAKLLDAARRAGLQPLGIDLAAFGMIRALDGARAPVATGPVDPVEAAREAEAGHERRQVEQAMAADIAEAGGGAEAGVLPDAALEPGAAPVEPVRMFCSLADITNLAVARGSVCLFTRTSTFGVEGIAQRLAERRRLALDHARQWLTHVGLDRPLEGIEGDAATVADTRAVLEEGVAKLADELRMSMDFYAAQEGAPRVEAIVACGAGTTIPGLGERLQAQLGLPLDTATAPALGKLDGSTAARLTLSYGLALEE